ncbi:pyridoxamine kinase [Sutterella sp.]|uniref:pyridoxamine kinase n=1 Tax=Sutterella sp. TaxID=1981025 RepID=UPI0026DF1293|nr:pyridoxamine kinase [Sutterella sp.]MDO5532326.1 pyridoxamine kinase [Sutterella sp.]
MHSPRSTRRIAAVHDLSGVGRVSLTVVMPILTTMGFDVCPLPTAILSNHTQYPSFSFLDLTDEMPKIIAEWEKLGVDFDAIYTGYLGSPRQIRIVADFIDRFRKPETLIVVDPVLGDNGKLYAGMSEDMVGEMRTLARRADVLTPNLTELFALLGRPFHASCTDAELKDAIIELSERREHGPDTVIITGVPVVDQPKLTSVIARSRSDGRCWKVTCPYMPAHYPGTGDAFTSVITGSLLQGDSLPIALDRAAQFILQGIRATFGYQGDNREGILLERVLPNLANPIQSASWELL